jgi:hypothetical protein
LTWEKLIEDIINKGAIYIGGDCGFSHFILSLHKTFRPENCIIYYNTKGVIEKGMALKSIAMYPDRVNSQFDFRPYTLFEDGNVNILPF